MVPLLQHLELSFVVVVAEVVGIVVTVLVQDRFHTVDFNPRVYTEFGFGRASHDTMVDLLNRHLGFSIPRTRWLTKLPGATHK